MILSDLTNNILNKLDAISQSILTKLNTIENKITSSSSNSGSSVIRKITRGTKSGNGDITISCTITDPNKVIVLLNADLTLDFIEGSSKSGGMSLGVASGGSVYLKSISTTGITVNAKGLSVDTYYDEFEFGSVTFSYQIIEFM